MFHEKDFSLHIRRAMVQQGWLHDSAIRLSGRYGLVLEDLVSWVQASQPSMWAKLVKRYGGDAGNQLMAAVRTKMHYTGTLAVLREGVLMPDVSDTAIRLMAGRPYDMNRLNLLDIYRSNRLRVLSEVSFSKAVSGRLDFVLTLNGIPTATVELKLDQNQSVDSAIRQYKNDRDVSDSLLLSPVEGACVHFAVSDAQVFSCGWLRGKESAFLPFNMGDGFGAGNPINPTGYATEYLWRDVWSPDSWIELCGNMIKVNGASPSEGRGWIFPRFHQWDVVRKALYSVYNDGFGRPHLIQHSAGSGKTKTIAWLADALSRAKDDRGHALYAGVIVISDREVIDRQLQQELDAFSSMPGWVETIRPVGQSKNSALRDALSSGRRIIVCTIQTFLYMREEIGRLGNAGQRYAVLADEAHSSQSGKNATAMRGMFYRLGEEDAQMSSEVVDADGNLCKVWECIVDDDMKSRVSRGGRITFFAFTATPKAKTVEMFGTLPNPELPMSVDNKPVPFHTYSMRQAIAEGFILDVLRNYTTFDILAKVSLEDQADSIQTIDSHEGQREIVRWVRQHPDSIEARSAMILDHYLSTVQPLLAGSAKAMVVSQGRMDAVLMARALHARALRLGKNVRVMVAFSGTIEADDMVYSESSVNMELGGFFGDLAQYFADNGHILVVANKFQTGFDQPLLCGMYVDRGLTGVQAVQTLSRLNRTYLGKNRVYVLDFANKMSDIYDAFAPYYTATNLALSENSDIVRDLRSHLEGGAFCTPEQAAAVAEAVVLYRRNNDESYIFSIGAATDVILNPIRARWRSAHLALESLDENNSRRAAYEEQIKQLYKLRQDIRAYVKAYEFFSQMELYSDRGFEYLYIAASAVLPRLHFHDNREVEDIAQLVLDDYRLISIESQVGPEILEDTPVELNASFSSEISEKVAFAALEEVTMGELVDDFNKIFSAIDSNVQASTEKMSLLVHRLRNYLSNKDLYEVGSHTTVLTRNTVDLKGVRQGLMYLLADDIGTFSDMAVCILNDDEICSTMAKILFQHLVG